MNKTQIEIDREAVLEEKKNNQTITPVEQKELEVLEAK